MHGKLFCDNHFQKHNIKWIGSIEDRMAEIVLYGHRVKDEALPRDGLPASTTGWSPCLGGGMVSLPRRRDGQIGRAHV